METAFLALVNYITAGLLLAYNVQAFLCVRKKEQRGRKAVAIAMKAEIALIFILCFFDVDCRFNKLCTLVLSVNRPVTSLKMVSRALMSRKSTSFE